MKTVVMVLFCLACQPLDAATVSSPGSRLRLVFELTAAGEPTYQLFLGDRPVILPSRLGLTLKDQPAFDAGFAIAKTETNLVDETWEPVWGEVRRVRDFHRELKVTLKQASAKDRVLVLTFRLFEDGLGFRYEFPAQPGFIYFIVSDERTEFRLTGNHECFWIPGDSDTNEYEYTRSRLDGINALKWEKEESPAVKAVLAPNAVQTPFMMKSAEGLYINVHEAALAHYPAMNLLVNKGSWTLGSQLVPDPVGNKAYLQTPCATPWRTVIVSDRATDILASKLILNLNEPCKLKDVSWIRPMKFMGVWWEMHVGLATWNYSDTDSTKIGVTDWAALKPNGRHGANTANVKRYIDFAAAHHIDAVLAEGWNVGWEDWFGKWKEQVFDFVTPYPDFDLPELEKYAAGKGVKLLMHHETAAAVTDYERRMDAAYRFMKAHGFGAVKTGYVGRIIPRGEHHDGQWMVDHYLRVAQKTAEYQIMLDAHEPHRPTGEHRTYPNWMSSEAARGNEYNAWGSGNPPDHETILPFTRLMGGPMDYTPGIFQTRLDYYVPGKKERVHTTLAKQLALYVTIYSPLQMAADLPQTYERFADAFQFIEDVPVDWDDTKILEAEPGQYITIARKARNRDEWYLGAVTGWNARTASIPLSFIEPNRSYRMTVYADGKDADWDKNPQAYEITSGTADSKTVLTLRLAPGGGAAVSLKAAH